MQTSLVRLYVHTGNPHVFLHDMQQNNNNKFPYLTYFLPNFIASRLLLEAERQVKVVPLRPHDQGLLLLLVSRVRLNPRLQQERS